MKRDTEGERGEKERGEGETGTRKKRENGCKQEGESEKEQTHTHTHTHREENKNHWSLISWNSTQVLRLLTPPLALPNNIIYNVMFFHLDGYTLH